MTLNYIIMNIRTLADVIETTSNGVRAHSDTNESSLTVLEPFPNVPNLTNLNDYEYNSFQSNLSFHQESR